MTALPYALRVESRDSPGYVRRGGEGRCRGGATTCKHCGVESFEHVADKYDVAAEQALWSKFGITASDQDPSQ